MAKERPTNPSLPDNGFIRPNTLIEFLGISRATLYRKAKEGTFPKPVKLGKNIAAFRVEEVREWMDNLKEAL